MRLLMLIGMLLEIIFFAYADNLELEEIEKVSNKKLKIKGKIAIAPKTVNYKIYVSKDGSFTEGKTQLILPEFIVSQTSECGFRTLPEEKIYVKRVNENGELIPLESTDKVEFKFQTDPIIKREWKWFGINYGATQVSIGQILGETIKSRLPNFFIFDDYGNIKIILNGTEYYYQTAKLIRFSSIENGVCQIEDVKNSYFDRADTLRDNQKIKEIEDIMKDGISIS